MIKDAMFISVWDDIFNVETNCKVDTDTHEVFDIKTVNVGKLGLKTLDTEYIIIDGHNHNVYDVTDFIQHDDWGEYWYGYDNCNEYWYEY